MAATGTKDAGSGPRVTFAGHPVQAGWPGVTGPPVVVGTGVGAAVVPGVPLAADGEVAVDPPDRGVLTEPHPATSVAAATSGTAARSAARPARRLASGVSGVSSVIDVNI
jgi:hypothetical protein